MTYKGCTITTFKDGFIWEEPIYGAEGDDVFATVAAAKADIDLFFTDGPAPVVFNNEVIA